MTTSTLALLFPGDDARHLALVLERLEDEVEACGACYGMIVDRAGAIVAYDGLTDERQTRTLAAQLTQVFQVCRSLARTFREWPVGTSPSAIGADTGGARLITQPLGPEWLLAMGFPTDTASPPTTALSERWRARLGPLAPQRDTGRARESRRRARAAIQRDTVNLLFKDE